MIIQKHLLLLLFVLVLSTFASAQPWLARHGLSAADYQTEFNKLTANGYRPVQVSGYGGRFAAIFEKPGSSYPLVARHNLTAIDYQTEFNKWTAQGYRPVSLRGYAVGNQARYAVVFEKQPNSPAWIARHGLSDSNYQIEFTKWTGQGYRPADISAY